MDILFILFGVALFFAAAAVFAIDHIKVNPAQAVVSFLVPPFAWWLYYHFWEKSRVVAYTQGVAIVLLVGGVLMNLWFPASIDLSEVKIAKDKKVSYETEQDYVGSDASLRDLAEAERISAVLNGRVLGRPFKFSEPPDVAEFDSVGVLRIKHGEEFYGDFELAIVFNEIPTQESKWLKTYRSDTKGAPVIYLSWFDKESQIFKSRKYDSGYNLDFSVTHVEYNLFTGQMQLVLPDPQNTFLVGEFPIYSSRLRFHGEGLITSHDSVDTLEAIAYHTLKVTYKKYVLDVAGFRETDYDYRSGSGLGETKAYVKAKDGKLREIKLVFYKNESGWFLDVKGLQDSLKNNDLVVSKVPAGTKPPIVIDWNNIGTLASRETIDPAQEAPKEKPAEVKTAEVVKNEPAPEQQAQQVESKPAPSGPQSIKIDVVGQAEQIESLLSTIFNKDVELETTEGKVKKGIYVGVHRQQLVLEIEVGGGVVEYLTEYRKLKTLKVLNAPDVRPQRVDFFHPQSQ